MAPTIPESNSAQPPAWESDDFEIPPFLRFPSENSREATEMMISRIDGKITQLATLGLRPHPIMLGYRSELVEQLTNNGPYRLRMSGGMF